MASLSNVTHQLGLSVARRKRSEGRKLRVSSGAPSAWRRHGLEPLEERTLLSLAGPPTDPLAPDWPIVPLEATAFAVLSEPTSAEWEGITPAPALLEQRSDRVDGWLTLSGIGLESIVAGGMDFTALEVPGWGYAGSMGQAALPVYRTWIAVPEQAELQWSYTIDQAVSLGRGIHLYPVQPPRFETTSRDVSFPAFAYDAAYYASTETWANVLTVSGPMQAGDQSVVLVEVCPFRYTPGSGQLDVATDVHFSLQFEPASDVASEAAGDSAGGLTSPSADLPTEPSGGAMPELVANAAQADYLIITADAFYEEVLPLAQWKHKSGYKTYVARMSEVGGTSYLDVYNYIKAAYDADPVKPKYVLLVGDHENVPSYQIVGHAAYPSGHIWHSDYDYSLLAGNDWLPDVAIGRLPGDTEAQISLMVNRTLAYEKTPDPGSWYDDVLLAAMFQDSENPPPYGSDPNNIEDRWFMEDAHRAADFLGGDYDFWSGSDPYNKGYTVHTKRVWESSISNTLHYRAEDWPGRVRGPDPIPDAWKTSADEEIATVINNGVGLVMHRDHGWQGGWADPAFGTSQVSALANGSKLPFVLSLNCETAWFDDGDYFGEAWMRNPNGGAVAFTGAVRISLSGYNDAFHAGIFDSMWNDYDTFTSGVYSNSWHFGEAINYAKHRMFTSYGTSDEYAQLSARLFNVFGDPEIMLRTQTPSMLSVTHPASVEMGRSTPVVVEVRRAGLPVPGATVCISRGDSTDYWVAVTGPNGQANFPNVVTQEIGSYDIVVTERNAIPYEGTIQSVATTPFGRLESPPAGGGINVDRGYVDVQWIDYTGTGINTSTIDPNDITITGVTVSGVSRMDFDTWRYTYSGSLALGDVDVNFVANQVLANNGMGNPARTDSFVYETTPPYVIDQSLRGPAVYGPVNALRFVFSERMNPNSFSVAQDVVSFTGPGGTDLKSQILGFQWLTDNTVLEVQFSPQTLPGNYQMVIGPQITDRAGNPMDQNMIAPAGQVPGDRFTGLFGIRPDPSAFFQANLNINPGWTTSGEWQFGRPTGQGGGPFGNPDPTSGHTGMNVYGVNLNGDYSTTPGGPYYLVTRPIDCSTYDNVHLRFWRWLNTDYPPWVESTVDVSNDGTHWTNLYSVPFGEMVKDDHWISIDYDVASVADRQNTVYFRWGYAIVTGPLWGFSGWNIDDIELVGDAANRAPTLDPIGQPALPSVLEDQTAGLGMSIADLIASVAPVDMISDSDAGAVEGIAVIGADTYNGSWDFSTDNGTTWSPLGMPTAAQAVLLAADGLTRIRFVPKPDFSGTISNALVFRAWDQTTGTNGGVADTTMNGGLTAFSSATETASIVVLPVNDAPVLDPAGTMRLTAIGEDDFNNPGNTVASLVLSAGGNRIQDIDPGAVEGIAIIGADNTNGTWQYTINGTDWLPMGTPSDSEARLLADDGVTKVRFVPNADFSGTVNPGITFRAWDRTSGTNGGEADASVNGGTTAFSTAVETASIQVNPVNDAPVLDNSGALSLVAIAEDPTTNPGTLISTLLASGGGNPISDVDPGAQQGIAVIAVDNTHGTWQYTTNNGANWWNFGSVTEASARLLAADSQTRIRFQPKSNFSGTVDPGITFRAWDRTVGSNGGVGNATVYGGTTAFSAAVETASIQVTPSNDAPVLDNTGNMILVAINEDEFDNAGTLVSALVASAGGDRISDMDPGAVEGIAVTAVNNSNGTWQYSTDGGSSWNAFGTPTNSAARLLAADANTRVRFVPNPNYNGTVSAGITFRAWDQTSGTNGGEANCGTGGGSSAFSTATETASITVQPVNDAPVLDPSGAMVLLPIVEDEPANSGTSVSALVASAGGDRITDPDTGALEGIAVLAVDDTNGQWQFSTNSGGSWTPFGAVTATTARLLAADTSTRIRFVPNVDYSGTIDPGITFRAWDRTTGSNGEVADASVAGGTTAFSTATETAGLVISARNDPPQRTAGTVADLAIPEDTGIVSLGLEGLAYGPGGGADESGQSLTFSVTAVPPSALGHVVLADGNTVVQPGTYTLTQIQGMQFRALANTSGGPATFRFAVKDDGGTANGGSDTLTESIAITVLSVNDPPVRTAGTIAPLAVLEDSPAVGLGLGGLAYGPGGGGEENGQTLSYVVTEVPPAAFGTILLADGTTVVAPGPYTLAQIQTMRFRPSPNAAGGPENFRFEVRDSGGTANGGIDTLAESLPITIAPINDAPSFQKGADVTVLEDAGPQTVAGWATGIVPGPADEAAQNVQFLVSCTNAALFAVAPALDAAGNLTFTPADDANGQATVTVQLQDDGGTAQGGQDTSAPQSFTITVTAVNDAPAFTKGPDVMVLEDSGPQVIAHWATNLLPGPDNEASQTCTFALTWTEGGLFASPPAISPDGTLRFTPAANASGQSTVTVRLTDNGGTAHGGQDASGPQIFTITVNPVNDKPLAIGQGLATDAGSAVSTVLTGEDRDPEVVQALQYAMVTAPAHGTITAFDPATGDVTYTPHANFYGLDSFTFRVIDDAQAGTPGALASDPATVTIRVHPVLRAPTTGSGDNDLLLRRRGNNLQLLNKRNNEVLFNQPLTSVFRLTLLGAANRADRFTVDFSGGAFQLQSGLVFDGGSGTPSDTIVLLGSSGAETLGVSRADQLVANSLAVDIRGIEQIRLEGGSGNDRYLIAALPAPVTISDTSGTDIVDFSHAGAGVTLDLAQVKGQAQTVLPGQRPLALLSTIEDAVGSAYADLIRGNSAANRIRGGAGNDTLYGGSGNDWLYGDAGDDRLYGDSGNNVLLGGSGNDRLFVSSGRNLLLGGAGSDELTGASGEDLLIGATTRYDNNDAALAAILAEWSNTLRSFTTRVNNLINGIAGGTIYLRKNATLYDDFARDQMFGGASSDWFLDFAGDLILDLTSQDR